MLSYTAQDCFTDFIDVLWLQFEFGHKSRSISFNDLIFRSVDILSYLSIALELCYIVFWILGYISSVVGVLPVALQFCGCCSVCRWKWCTSSCCCFTMPWRRISREISALSRTLWSSSTSSWKPQILTNCRGWNLWTSSSYADHQWPLRELVACTKYGDYYFCL